MARMGKGWIPYLNKLISWGVSESAKENYGEDYSFYRYEIWEEE